jgi:hypothetical protein
MSWPRRFAFDSSKRRGHWLRCFLGSTLFAVGMAWTGAAVHAQPDAPEPMHVARLRGVYVNAKGAPIQGAEVTLVRNDKVFFATKTDAAGKFAFKHVSGRYWLRANVKNYSTLSREVVVGLEALTYLHSNTLYVIAGPGACTDDCSSVFTSRDKFDETIKRNMGHSN